MVIPFDKKKSKKAQKKTEEVAISGEMSLGTTYDLNKDLVKRYEKELTTEELQNKKELYLNFIQNNIGNYYMLLCNERKDYTVFHFTDNNKIRAEELSFNELLECLINRGKVYGFDKTEDSTAIEIWLMINDEAYAYYFFNYDNAVIEC